MGTLKIVKQAAIGSFPTKIDLLTNGARKYKMSLSKLLPSVNI